MAAVLDAIQPALSITYFLPALYLTMVTGRAAWVLSATLTLSVLLVPVLASPDRATSNKLFSRGLGISTALFMAYLVRERRRIADRLQAANEQLETRVALRSAEVQQRLLELTVLNRIGGICANANTEDKLLGGTTAVIAETLFPDNCGFLLLDAARGMLVTHSSFALSDPAVSREDKALGTGIVGQVAFSGRGRRVGDVSQEPGYLAADSRTRSELCLPMRIGAKVVGVLNVESQKQNAFSESDEQLMGTVVDLVGNALERLRAEQALRDNQQFLRSIAEATPHWIYIFDFDEMRTIYTNRSILSDLGYAPKAGHSAMRLETFREYMPPEEIPHLARVLDECQNLPDGQLRRDEYSLRHADGSLCFFAAREIAFARRPDGTVRQILGTLSEITERKRAEQSLRASEQRFALFMQHLPGLAWIKDAQGRYVYANDAAVKVFRTPRAELYGKTDHEVFQAEIAAQFQAADRRALASGMEVQAVEVLEHEDGVLHHAIVSKFPIPAPGGGEVLVGGMAIDVTEQQRAEETVRKLNTFREAVIRTAAEGICVCLSVPEFPYVEFSVWNDQMTALTGYSMDEINRLGWYQTLYPDPNLRERAQNRMAAMRYGDDLRAEEWEITRRDGRRRTLAISTSLVETEAGQPVVVALMQDVTDRKQAEKTLQESEARYHLITELASSFCYQATVTSDGRTTFLWVGGKLQQVTGYRPEDLTEAGWLALIPFEDRPEIQAKVAGLGSSRPDLSEALELRILTRQGEVRWIRSVVHVVPPARPGEPMTLYGAVLDITDRQRAEAALRDSEERFQAFMNQSPVVAWVKDQEFRYRYVNSAFEQLFDLPTGDILGRTDYDLYRKESADETRSNDSQVLELGRIVDAIEQVPGADGRLRQWLVQKFPLHRIGQPTWVGGTAVDVTARMEAEAAIQESEARFRLLFEGANDAIFWADAVTGLLTHCNRAAETLLGRERAEIIGQPQTFLHPPEQAGQYRETFRLHASSASSASIEAEVVRKDGQRIVVSISPSVTTIGGRPIIQGIFRDITERKRAEDTIRRILDAIAPTTGQTYFSTLADYLSATCGVAFAFVAVVDPDNPNDAQTIAVSHSGEPADNIRYDLRGTPCAKVVGWDLCYYPTDVQREFPNDHLLAKMGVASYMGIPLWSSKRDALGLIVLLNDRPIPDPDQARVLLQVVAARSGAELERRRSEETMRRMEAQILHAQKLDSLGLMAGGIAHDFNNLLTAMLGYTHLAVGQLPGDSLAAPLLAEVEKAARQASELTRQLLAYAGKGRIVVQPLKLDTLVSEMAQLMQTAISRKARVELALDPAAIVGDAVQIRQIVMNLMTNASDALGDQAGRICIRTGTKVMNAAELRSPYFPDALPAGRHAFVEVDDNGCGMSEETLARIFDPFFTTKFTGRGLGMAAVLGIVRRHEGLIKVTSKPGQGTLFEVLFPSAEGTGAAGDESISAATC